MKNSRQLRKKFATCSLASVLLLANIALAGTKHPNYDRDEEINSSESSSNWKYLVGGLMGAGAFGALTHRQAILNGINDFPTRISNLLSGPRSPEPIEPKEFIENRLNEYETIIRYTFSGNMYSNPKITSVKHFKPDPNHVERLFVLSTAAQQRLQLNSHKLNIKNKRELTWCKRLWIELEVTPPSLSKKGKRK